MKAKRWQVARFVHHDLVTHIVAVTSEWDLHCASDEVNLERPVNGLQSCITGLGALSQGNLVLSWRVAGAGRNKPRRVCRKGGAFPAISNFSYLLL